MKISVLLCVYAKDDVIAFDDALASILSQTRLPTEVVIVADGPLTVSLDKTLDKYNKLFKKIGVSFVCSRLELNSGHGLARQHGLTQLSFDYVIICDADDLNRKDRFEKLINAFDFDPELDVVGSNILEVDSLTLQPLGVRAVASLHSDIIRDLASRCPFNQMSVAFKKSSVLKCGGYKNFYHNEDYYLWIRMHLGGCKFRNLEENLVYARVNREFYGRRGGIKYFLSELRIQVILLKNQLLSIQSFIYNVFIRFIVQVILPAKLRGLVFRKFARRNYVNKDG